MEAMVDESVKRKINFVGKFLFINPSLVCVCVAIKMEKHLNVFTFVQMKKEIVVKSSFEVLQKVKFSFRKLFYRRQPT
jgi:hypothetical protein